MPETDAPRTRQQRMPIGVRREQVLDAALRLISQHGYASATMEAIAREADLAKPVVYKAYPGLGPLLQALLQREEERAFSTLSVAMLRPTDADPIGILLSWLDRLAHAVVDNPGPWRLILIPPDETPFVVREHVQAGREVALELLRSLIGEVVDRRTSPVPIDQELFAQVILAAAEHLGRLLLRDPDNYSPERLVAFAASMLNPLQLTPTDRGRQNEPTTGGHHP
ncbi:MAG TPA: TetR/AcrR family transcriptional regulator [Acidimicrobiales bacterium]|jgi:AcrR family transcriptional regulator|nr:TetR/AcrR family transcriptional regulator [Acidimicrobiales bacterium]